MQHENARGKRVNVLRIRGLLPGRTQHTPKPLFYRPPELFLTSSSVVVGLLANVAASNNAALFLPAGKAGRRATPALESQEKVMSSSR